MAQPIACTELLKTSRKSATTYRQVSILWVIMGNGAFYSICPRISNALFASLVLWGLGSILANGSGSDHQPVTNALKLMDGPVYLQHIQAKVLCMAECERILYLNDGRLPGLIIQFHIFSNYSNTAEDQQYSNSAAERCSLEINILRNGMYFGHTEIEFPSFYHIIHLENAFGDPNVDRPANSHLQSLFALFEVDVMSFACVRHSEKIVLPTPIRIGSRSVRMQWAETWHEQNEALVEDKSIMSSHHRDGCSASVADPALMVAWMMSLQRRPERWEWGRASAASVGLNVARWLVVDGRREDARSCIDIETSLARGFGVRSIQPYTALSAALSHKLLHRAIADSGPYAGLCATPQTLGGQEHGPGRSDFLSCDLLLAPVNLSHSMDTGVDWVVIVEDDLQPNVTSVDLKKVMKAIPLNFDLIWLGHCPCIWNGPASLPNEFAPVVSIGISNERVVQLWRGSASCLHAYAVNPSSTHITSSFINLFDGVQWKPACERGYLRCLVAVVVPLERAEYIHSINGLPGMFDQNKDLASEIHNAPL